MAQYAIAKQKQMQGDEAETLKWMRKSAEGDLILAASAATPEKIAFMVRHTSGLLCVPMEPLRLDELALPLMVLTLGLFAFVINAALLWATDQLIEDFEIETIGATLGAAVVITLANVLLEWIVY